MKNPIAALLLIILGIVLLLNNLGYTSISLGQLISTWWPVILILFGIGMLVGTRRN